MQEKSQQIQEKINKFMKKIYEFRKGRNNKFKKEKH